MNLREALNQVPSGWGRQVSAELLEACFPPAEAPERSVLPNTHLRSVILRCEPAASSSLGPRAFKIDYVSAEWFVRLGWEPIPYFDSMPYMRAPMSSLSSPSSPVEILVPIPDEQALLDFAYETAAAGQAWQGTAWLWPATFAPAHVARGWDAGGRGLWDGENEQGRPTGGMFEWGPGWRDMSTLATFEIGHRGIWHAKITWPGPFVNGVLWVDKRMQERKLNLGGQTP